MSLLLQLSGLFFSTDTYEEDEDLPPARDPSPPPHDIDLPPDSDTPPLPDDSEDGNRRSRRRDPFYGTFSPKFIKYTDLDKQKFFT